ncbi:hypothetical protein NBRC116594_16050 [Shimia sp. NS0008-38b]
MISPAALNARRKELQTAGFVHRIEGGYAATVLGLRLYDQLRPFGTFRKDWESHFRGPSH